MSYKCEQLMDVMVLSETMLKDAESGNWESVFSVEAQRSKVLKELFLSPFSLKEKKQSNEMIRQLISINKKIAFITVQARDNMGQDVSTINKGRHAVDMYAQNTGF